MSVSACDKRVYAYAQRPTWARARILPVVSNLADHSLVWAAIAAILALQPGERRQAALRGVLSIAISSGIANVVGKPLFHRRRPPAAHRALMPLLRRTPVSQSFPSGHAASAAAFATGVAVEVPSLGLPVGLLAAAVGWSRITTGVHYPSDVVAGVLLGSASALATTRWQPVRRNNRGSCAGPQRAMSPGTHLRLVM